VIVERSMDSRWLSNAYVVGSEAGGTAVFVDSGAPLEPLFAAVERERLRPTHLLITHGHGDHVAGNDEIVARYGVPVETGDVTSGGLRVRALPTPGHHDDMVAFVVNDEVVFTGDTLFRGSVGGGDFEEIRRSVIDVLMKLPPETRVLPGHTDETTIGREWEENPFVRIWRGVDPEGTSRCRVGAEEAQLVLLAPDYDHARGGTKAWVRFADGRDAIVGGSRVAVL
jgi:glyoxylase-like metal-dependent hydrolase (beta-lactamase superfamily II)